MARPEARRVAVFQPDDRAPLGVDETLLEDVVEEVLEVEELGAIADLDQLCSHRLLRTRRLVVGDPELGDVVNREHCCVDESCTWKHVLE